MSQPLIVQAEYSFKGGNNDELCFKKGDLITVTQREEGGWWEGTLNDKTGWFPSNYVNEYKAPLPLTETIRPPEEIQEYRSVVLKDLLDSERAHVAEIQGLLENFLEPLQQTQILNADEYAQLMCNFVEIVKTHEELLKQMEECNDRVGKLFLTKAPQMKQVHQAYCAAHPKAIVILDKHKDELEKYMERQGAASPGLLVLTTGLSKPFRRLDKYSAMLQELERHMESSHPDRGDTQRSVAVYKDIAAACSATRRQKELELQVLTGPVRGWQGQELSSLGDIIHMGSVAVGPDHRDRYFVLFPQTLLILSVSQRMSAFIYEGKLPLTGIIVNRLEDSETVKNAFEISGPLIERIIAVCQGPNEASRWVELLTSANPSVPIGIKRQLSNLSNASISGGGSSGQAPQPPPHNPHILDPRGYSTRFSLCAYYAAPPCKPYRITLPPSNYPPTAPYANLSAHFAKLVKAGRLRSTLVKMLLYPQARQSIDLKRIPMRKKRAHKSSAKMKKSTQQEMDYSNCSERSELERQDAFELPTDSESDECDEDDDYEKYTDCDSNPFEYVKFHANAYDSKNTALTNDVQTTRHKERHCSSINLIKLDSDSTDDCARHSAGPAALQKESLVIGSRAMQALVRKSTDSVVIHTTTAHLDLSCSGGITSCVEELSEESADLPKSLLHQASQTSHSSSVFCERLGGAYVACENLAKMSDETKIKLTAQDSDSDSPAERHSMPNLFVGNRFNRSSNTAVYVPTWQDRKEAHNLSVDALKQQSFASENATDEFNYSDNDDDDDDDDVTHSSTLDLPAECLMAPDKLQAELLYNFDESCLDRQTIAEEFDDIISPPSMFKPQFLFEQNARSIDQQEQRKKTAATKEQPQVGVNAAALPSSQSTTELYIEPQRSSGGSDSSKQKRPDSIRRCISYQFVQMSNDHVVDGAAPLMEPTRSGHNGNQANENFRSKNYHLDRNIPAERMRHQQQQLRKENNGSSDTKCRCCESSECPSPRSSDSGMAGSCTITSPDPPLVNDVPFGNYYVGEGFLMPASTNSDSNAITDLTRFDVCGMFRAKFLTPEAPQDVVDNVERDAQLPRLHHQYSFPLATTATDGAPISTITTAELQISTSNATIDSVATNSSHQLTIGSQPNMQFSSSLDNTDSTAMASTTDGQLFRSGMYAHWWKKEKLPPAVVRGIAKALQSPQLSKDSRCSMCSSCVSGAGSGFSEGTAYSSLCRECVCFCRSSTGTPCDTNTTTTNSMTQCPLCSAGSGESADTPPTPATGSERLSHASFSNGGAVTATTTSTSTVSSPASSLDCPICKGLIARGESMGSILMADDEVASGEKAVDQHSSHANANSANAVAVVEDVPTRESQHAGGATHKLPKPSGSNSRSFNGNINVTSVTHKRSLSFNHHLSYNQYTHTQPPPPHHHLPPPQQSLPNHPVAPSHKSNLAPTSSSISKNQHQTAGNMAATTNARIGNTKANWSIKNLRPAPPLRPNLLNAMTHSGSGGSGSGGGASGSSSANALASYCSGKRMQPTFEEDVLVLRVFEGYCAAYQNTTRNTIHSALQPWTPCLPIRGGKLQTSKTFSTSNPQLPHLCQTGAPFPGSSSATNQQNSTNSLNSSYIWREASPNNFNLYSSSVSSLNAATTGVAGGVNAVGYRYSLSGSSTGGAGPSSLPIYERALSEERATRKSLNRLKSGFGSGYDNIFMTPLLPRKNKPSPKLVKNSSYQAHQRSPPSTTITARNRSDSERLDATPLTITEQEPSSQRQSQKQQRPPAPGLYDRRLNRSFETTVSHRYAGYGGGYMMSGYGQAAGYKMTPMRRSTPQLAGGDVVNDARDSDEAEHRHRGCGAALLGNGNSVGNCAAGADHETGTTGDGDSQRHSGSWCCGLENEDMTPTLRQLWTAIRQMQQEMSQMKLQMNEERALRTSLQQLLMQHLETGSAVSNTPKC
ncbi:LOW QUALITY PROTEIN: uncharacterized protein LOC128863897 [Anastrepha ludens]|uniref:LOW QUALITY PROTEIN: uncharacterized protein LOC128863897 n=1 Tax=Anastrepha ludens TaxID=28586 RepID=UPI0023AF69F1|nr:LOW QUALITY PROTEIN: uncharacterized protein LOC128863897 [Anastrepha ludens]